MAEYIPSFVLYSEEVFQGTDGLDATDICLTRKGAESQLIAILKDSGAPGTAEEIATRVRLLPTARGSLMTFKSRRSGTQVIGKRGAYLIVHFICGDEEFFAVCGPGGSLVLPLCPTFGEADALARKMDTALQSALDSMENGNAPTP